MVRLTVWLVAMMAMYVFTESAVVYGKHDAFLVPLQIFNRGISPVYIKGFKGVDPVAPGHPTLGNSTHSVTIDVTQTYKTVIDLGYVIYDNSVDSMDLDFYLEGNQYVLMTAKLRTNSNGYSYASSKKNEWVVNMTQTDANLYMPVINYVNLLKRSDCIPGYNRCPAKNLIPQSLDLYITMFQ